MKILWVEFGQATVITKEEAERMLLEEQDKLVNECRKVESEFNLKPGEALNVIYLRTRARWSPELEIQLIKEMKDGKRINICDWPENVHSPL